MERIDKVNELLRREISHVLQHDFEDPRMAFVSVTAVDTSKDLRNARVSVSYFGDSKDLDHVLTALNRAGSFVRGLVGRKVRIRIIPALRFVYDGSSEYGARIEQTIEEIHQMSDAPREEDIAEGS